MESSALLFKVYRYFLSSFIPIETHHSFINSFQSHSRCTNAHNQNSLDINQYFLGLNLDSHFLDKIHVVEIGEDVHATGTEDMDNCYHE
jgi:hypothetical protein